MERRTKRFSTYLSSLWLRTKMGYAILKVFRFLIRGRLNILDYLRELMIPEIIFTVVTTLFLYRLILFINRWLKRMENRRDTTIV